MLNRSQLREKILKKLCCHPSAEHGRISLVVRNFDADCNRITAKLLKPLRHAADSQHARPLVLAPFLPAACFYALSHLFSGLFSPDFTASRWKSYTIRVMPPPKRWENRTGFRFRGLGFLTLLLPFFVLPLQGQTAVRGVLLTWSASTSTGILGYTVSRATSPTGPWTLLTPSPVNALTWTDSNATIGQTYTYQVVTVAPACTPTTPVGQVCGSSAGILATTTVPAAPTSVVTVTVVVQ